MVTVNPNGDFSFIPNHVGNARFFYQATDSSVPPCTSKPAPVNITIEQGPVALPSTFDACENTPFMSGLAPYVSGGIPPFMFLPTGVSPTCGTVSINPTSGVFTFTGAWILRDHAALMWFVTDAANCPSNNATATVNVHPTPTTTSSGPFTGCTDNPFTVNLNNFTTGGTPPYMFAVFNPINGTVALSPPSSAIAEFTPVAPGPGSFDFNASDTFSCVSNTSTISFNVLQSPTLTPAADPINTCQDNPISSSATATGGTPPYVFSITATTNGTAMIDSVVLIRLTLPSRQHPDSLVSAVLRCVLLMQMVVLMK